MNDIYIYNRRIIRILYLKVILIDGNFEKIIGAGINFLLERRKNNG